MLLYLCVGPLLRVIVVPVSISLKPKHFLDDPEANGRRLEARAAARSSGETGTTQSYLNLAASLPRGHMICFRLQAVQSLTTATSVDTCLVSRARIGG